MENGLMLQREMDSTVDYGIPLVKPKKGFFQKLLNIINITKKVSTTKNKKVTEAVNNPILKWGWLKFPARLEVPAQIISIIFLGTLLGAAYAVTMQSGDKHYTLGEVGALSQQEPSQTVDMGKRPFQKDTTPEKLFFKTMPETTLESELMLSLNSIIDQQSKYMTSEYTNAPKHSTPSTATSNIVSEYERKKIRDLKKQLSELQQKSSKFDLNNLRLKGKLELLVAKNKTLSNRLRYIDNATHLIKNHVATQPQPILHY